MESTTFRTERLQLRPVRDEDVDRILQYRNLPEVTRWLLRTEVDAASFRAAWRRAAEDPGDHSKAVVLGGVVMGTVSLDVVDGMGQPGVSSTASATPGTPSWAGWTGTRTPCSHSRGG